jgi:hypothetical protein
MRTRMSGGVTGKAGDSLPMSIFNITGGESRAEALDYKRDDAGRCWPGFLVAIGQLLPLQSRKTCHRGCF